MSAASTPAPELQVHCRSCGVLAPTAPVTFRQNVGMVVTRQSAEATGAMCRRCARAYFRSYTLTTFFVGWCGVISFFIAPVFVLLNIIQYIKVMHLPEPPTYVANSIDGVLPKPADLNTGPSKLKILYGTAVWLILLGTIAFNQVDFVDKHFPKLNALLHSGEISDENDIQYVNLQMIRDVDALNADTGKRDYTGIRAAFMQRLSAFDDLKTNNSKLQREAERQRNLKSVGFCAQMSLDEYAPALDAYTRTTEQFLGILKQTPSPSPTDYKKLQELDEQRVQATNRVNAFVHHYQSEHCDKQ